MKIKDLRRGGRYAVRVGRWNDGEIVFDEFSVTYVRRERDSGQFVVRTDDGTELRISISSVLGTWEQHLVKVGVGAAADSLLNVFEERGWLSGDPDDDHELHRFALFGAPVYERDGKVVVEFTVDQAHEAADALRARVPMGT